MCENYVFYSVLAHLRRSGRGKNVKVSIFLKYFFYYGVSVLFDMALVFMCCGIGVPKGNGKAKRQRRLSK